MTTLHVHIPYPKVGEYLAYIKEHRLNLEIYFPSTSLDGLQPGDLDKLKKDLDYGPAISLHAPFMDMSPGAVDAKVQAVTLERFLQVMEIAEILSPGAVVFHSGYEKWKYAHRVDIWLEGSVRTWHPLIEKAASLGTRIAIENIFEDEPSNLLALMEKLHSEHFGICFDTGHCNLFSTVPLTRWLQALGPYIAELHLHDNDRSSDQHLPVGDGTFDFRTLFAYLRGKDCIHTIEAHTPERVLKSMKRLREYITISVNSP